MPGTTRADDEPGREARPGYLGIMLSVAVGAAMTPLLVGLPILGSALGQLIERARPEESARGTGSFARAGLLAAALVALASVIGVLAGMIYVWTAERFGVAAPLQMIALILGPALGALTVVPLCFVPWAALDDTPWRRLLPEALARAGRVGVLPLLRVAGILGLHALLPVALALAFELGERGTSIVGLAVGCITTLGLGRFTLEHLGALDARARSLAPTAARARLERRGLAVLALGPLALLALGVLAAMQVPERMVSVSGLRFEERLTPDVVLEEGTRIEPSFDGLHAYGPGEGYYEGDRYRWPGGYRDALEGVVLVEGDYGGLPALLAARVEPGGDRGAGVVLDREGHRLDSSAFGRLLAATPSISWALLGLAAMLGVALSVVWGRATARVALVHEAIVGRAQATSMRGTLRSASEGWRVARGRLLAEGATIESDDGAIRLAVPPTGATVIAEAPGQSTAKGEVEVTVLARGTRLGGAGLRSASAPLPENAMLVLGDPTAALGDLLARSFPVLATLGLALASLATTAALALIVAVLDAG